MPQRRTVCSDEESDSTLVDDPKAVTTPKPVKKVSDKQQTSSEVKRVRCKIEALKQKNNPAYSTIYICRLKQKSMRSRWTPRRWR